MFFIYFIVFTFVFTVFENVSVAIVVLLLIMSYFVIAQFLSKKKIKRSTVMWVLLSFFLVGISFGIKEWKYYGEMEIWKNGSGRIPGRGDNAGMMIGYEGRRNGETVKNENFVGTGVISDVVRQGRYVFDYQGEEYVLVSEKKFAIGDGLWVMGMMDPGKSTSRLDPGRNTGRRDEEPGGGVRIRGQNLIQEKYRYISKETFAVPIFSGGFDYGKRMKMKGRKGTIYEKNSITNDEGPITNRIGIIKSMKKSIQEKVLEAYGENKNSGLILGMLIGDRSEIPKTEYQEFIDSGLVHLIAVSGGNILMIVVFLQFALFRMPFYLRTFVILITIVGYSFICGMDSSVFRAMLMGGLSMVALFRGREINIWRLMSISAIVMLVINPYFLVYDVGFLLSYAALIGLIVLGNRDEEPGDRGQVTGDRSLIMKMVGYVWKNYISPSIGASVGIFPVIIFFMGRMNLMGIVGNLFVLPIVPFVMIYGFVSVYMYSWLGWEWILWIEKILVQYMYKVAELLAQYGVYISVSGLWLKYVVLLGGMAWLVWYRLKSKA